MTASRAHFHTFEVETTLDVSQTLWARSIARMFPSPVEAPANISADRSSIAYRRGLKRIGLGQFFLV